MKTILTALFSLVLGAILLSGPVLAADRTETEEPSIEILKVPNIPPGEGPLGPISGKVSGITPSDCRVVIYAQGDKFYVQPWAATPFTDIDKEHLTWNNQTHGGFSYVVLLVKKTFKPAAILSAPPEKGGDVLAVATKTPAPQ